MIKRVIIGMSGGVDSSVAAALLKGQGYEVIGVSLNLLTCHRPIERSCCSALDREDARKVCEVLKIEHRTIDCRAVFKKLVIDPFVREYLAGRTPSPCILCNEFVKFPALFEEVDRIDASHIATGHYARIKEEKGKYKFLKAVDAAKDQSYFLFSLKGGWLSRLIFPVGEMTKSQVREYARNFKLPTKEKSESQEVCFISAGDCAGFIEESAGVSVKCDGNFVDINGKVVGRHKGIHAYTVGQRRGLGFGIGHRQYVIKIIPQKNEVVLGGTDELMKKEIMVADVKWMNEENYGDGFNVKIRSTHAGSAAIIEKSGTREMKVIFAEPVRAPAPGQAAVFYRGDEMVGGGWICKFSFGEDMP